jgi:hypothetical protein
MSWPVIVSTLSLLFCAGAFFYFRAYIKRRTSRESVLAEIREEVNRLLLRIDEITDKDISLLEDKEKSLKALLEETEKRLQVYSRELERSLSSGRALAALSPKDEPPAALSSGARKPSGTYEDLGRNRPLVPGGTPTAALDVAEASAPGPVPLAAAPQTAQGVEPRFLRAGRQIPPEPKPIGERIRELADAGFSAPVIASRLGISITEVELAVALMDRSPEQPHGTC